MTDTNCNEDLTNSLNYLSSKINSITDPPERVIFGNQELANLLNISTRTLQEWRNNGTIGYAKVGKSIFYRLSDVLIMLESNFQKPFA